MTEQGYLKVTQNRGTQRWHRTRVPKGDTEQGYLKVNRAVVLSSSTEQMNSGVTETRGTEK